MRNLVGAIIIGLLLTLVGGCRRMQRLEPYGWRPLGGEFDSVTFRLERQLWTYAPVESLKLNIDRLERLAAADTTERRAKQARIHYWRARACYAASLIDSARAEALKGLAIADSVRDRYDYIRISSLSYLQDDQEYGLDRYRRSMDIIKYARSIGDNLMVSNELINVGNLLDEVGLYNEALQAFREADSLSEVLGFPLKAKMNKINVASALIATGDSAGCVNLLKSLERDPEVMADPHARNLVYRNIYAHSGDTAYLAKCYRDIAASDSRRALRGFIASEMSRQKFIHNDFDSGVYYADKAGADLPFVTDMRHRAAILRMAALSREYQRNYPEALDYFIQAVTLIDSAGIVEDLPGTLRERFRGTLEAEQMKYQQDLRLRNIALVAIAFVVIAAAIYLRGIMKRRRLRRDLERLQSELKLERARNTIAASSLTITEKDNLLRTLQSELGRMRRLGTISATDANSLESTIRSHLVENDSQAVFSEMFSAVNPMFSRRLRELCPDMSENTVTIAGYILMGLDTKRDVHEADLGVSGPLAPATPPERRPGNLAARRPPGPQRPRRAGTRRHGSPLKRRCRRQKGRGNGGYSVVAENSIR